MQIRTDRRAQRRSTPASGRRARSRVLALLPALIASLALAAPAAAQIQLQTLTSQTIGANATQAGAHADSQLTFITEPNPASAGQIFSPAPLESPRDISVDLPVGLAGSAVATPACTYTQLVNESCPADTQVGIVELITNPDQVLGQNGFLAVYNLVPARGQVAQFGFNVASASNVLITVSVRGQSDYGLHVEIHDVPSELLPTFFGTQLTLWGVPADPSHDVYRLQAGTGLPGQSSGAPAVPLLTNPTTCDGSQPATTMTLNSWQDPSHSTTQTAYADPVTGCDRLPFRPLLTLRPQQPRAGSPSAYDVDLQLPQTTAPNALGTADLKDVAVTLPAGVAISLSAAGGLVGCTSTDAGFGTNGPSNCPPASKIGTAEITTPLLGAPLEGSIYLGQPLAGNLFRIFLVVQGSGVVVKLEGTIAPNANTGQITTTFANNPQLPFSDLQLHFQGGSRAPLSNPPTCGTKTTSWTMTSWAGQTVQGSDSYAISSDANGAPCPASEPFSPTFSAGTVTPTGGKDSPFTLTFARQDTDQALGGIAVDLPRGLLGRISSVPLCPDGAAAAGSCIAVSQIGSATTTAGPGANPYSLPGRVYLTGPYRGAPFGLSIVVPAIAGPFDLGTVVVRAAIFVDPTTAALRVVSGPLPTIREGVPLQIRSVSLTLDRPGFMFNPTNCAASNISAVISAAGGGSGSYQRTRFQVGNCAALPFAPKLSVTIGRRGRTANGSHIPLTAILTQSAGQANNRVVDLTLPSTVNANLPALQHQCLMAAFLAGSCASSSRVGSASATTPVLRDPLNGSAYFVKNPRRGALPFLMVALRGQVSINLRAEITTPHGRLRTRFATIPDVPISRFRLSLNDSGATAALGARANLCTAKSLAAPASLAFRAQSNRLVKLSPRLHVAGCRSTTKR